MKNFVIKELVNSNILEEIRAIDFDCNYATKAVSKFKYKNLKIFGLSAAQANILKQLALSVGADCATPKNTITGMLEKADCILGGSVSQIEKIISKLGIQPFGLKHLANRLQEYIQSNIKKSSKTKIMGILNLTNNSFSDGGLYVDFDNAQRHIQIMIEEGADIIDIGAESTKPGALPISPQEQLERILPILKYINKQNIKIPISIDTRSADVARKCLDFGANAINDVSGLGYDKDMVKVIADYECPVVIQHSKGTPDVMQDNPDYENLMDEIFNDLNNKIAYAQINGIKKENIIIDPGIGFGKTREHNFEILNRLEEFRGLNCSILLGVSRKSLLNMSDADNLTKDIYTVALNTLAIERNVDIIRVHNVGLHRQLIDMIDIINTI